MSIGSRLKQWRTEKQLKQGEAGNLLGMHPGTYQKYELDTQKPGADAIEAFINAGINANWLLKGEGDMLLPIGGIYAGQGAEESVLNVREPAPMGVGALGIDDFALVPFYDVEASAGHGSHVGEELLKSQLAFRKDWLLKRGLQVGKCALITARGDSMESTISHGDILLVDTSIESIKDDAIYIVQSDHHLIVKRIQQSMDGSLTIISDNKLYKDQVLSPEQAKDVKIAGRVKWYGHEI